MDIKNETISNLEELVNQLEKLSFSPLPSTSKDSQAIKKDVNRLIMSIVSKLDKVLMNKLRIESVLKSLTIETNHYWSYISKYYQMPSVKFCNIHSSVSKCADKGKLWLLISITEKSLNESINEIYKQNFDKKFYDKNAIVITQKKEILELSSKLNHIYLFDVKADVNEDYLKYKENLLKKEGSNEEIDFLSPIIRKPSERDIEVTACPIEVITIDKKNTFYNNNNLNSLYFSRATIDLQPSNNDVNDNKLGIDSLFLAIESDDNYIQTAEDMKNLPTQPSHREKTFKPASIKIDDEKREFFTRLSLIHQEKDKNINIHKTEDFQTVYKEDFYTFIKKPPRRKDIYSQPSIDDNCNRSKNDLTLNPLKQQYYPFDKYFKVPKRTDKYVYTKKDVVLYNNKEIEGTNSVMFYLNNYYKKEIYYRFKTQINLIKPVTLESQNYQCAFCNKPFKTLLGFPTERIYWCSYYLRFACRDCISDDYSIIPAFILKSWNFKKFSISNKAKRLFEAWYAYPIISFKQNDPLIRKCEKLHSALLLKRKIHKIFDLIKCDKGNEFATKKLGEYQYLLLHENIFSLRDLVEINELTFFVKLREYLSLMEQHIKKDCSVCLYKGGKCIMCMSKEVIYAFDIENVIYCIDCRKMFHKKCCAVHPCIINR